MAYYSAVDVKRTAIVTNDLDDFHFGELEVLDGEDFLLNYAVKRSPASR